MFLSLEMLAQYLKSYEVAKRKKTAGDTLTPRTARDIESRVPTLSLPHNPGHDLESLFYVMIVALSELYCRKLLGCRTMTAIQVFLHARSHILPRGKQRKQARTGSTKSKWVRNVYVLC